MKKAFLISAICVIAIVTLGTYKSQAQMSTYKLHSLFVYNFVKNIKWDNVGNEFVIGVYGKAEALKEFRANFSNKNFSGKKFNIRSINNIDDAKTCQIVFIPKINMNKTTAMINAIKDQSILVVTEEDLVSIGASISFELIGSKLNFKISKSKTDSKGLKVSSSLAALGTVVS